MLAIPKLVVVVALLMMSAGAAFAQTLEYLGPSDGTGDGDTGVLGFNELCQATYGDGARFCTSQDVLRSGSPPAATNAVQWVMPTIVASVIDSLDWVLVIDITGQNIAMRTSRRGELSCRGWSNAVDSMFGLTMTSRGSFETLHCASDLPAACCKVAGGQQSEK